MRIVSLDLAAYGPFTGTTLDLSREGGLDVVYGANEAGKSTALRAIRGLFFGIAEKTTDDHKHAMKDLRVGARLRDVDGTELVCVRRKGRKSTLLSPSGEPLDEAVLARMLAGVSEALFVTTFGLDHETLRQGAEALLAGKGSVGESLLEAGLGARGLHALLGELRAEADGIHTPQAKQKPLAVTIAAYKAAEKSARDGALGVETWETQEAHLAAALAESAALEGEIRVAQESIHRIRRAERVLPKLRVREADTRERALLGELPLLAPSATREREEAEAQLTASTIELARLSAEIDELEARRGALVVPDGLLADGSIDALAERLGSHRKAAADLPKRLGELGNLREEASALTRRLGRPIGEALIDGHTTIAARVRKLAPVRALLAEQVENDRLLLEEEQAAANDARSELAMLPAALDTAPLVAALQSAQSRGDLDVAAAAADAEVTKLERASARRLAALGLADLPAAIPTSETVAEHERVWSSLVRRDEDVARRMELARTQHGAATIALAALLGAGDVVTEADLADARAQRDAALGSGERWAIAAPLVAKADAIADRMRREAERVARHAALVAERDGHARELARIERAGREVALEREAAANAWCAVWAGSGVAPRAPTEMRVFVKACDDERALRHAIVAAADARDALDTERRARASELRDALRASGVETAEGAGLGALTVRARARIAADAENAARRRQLERDARDHDARAKRLRAQSELHAAELEAHLAAWREATAELGATPPSPEEAVALMDDVEALARCLDKVAALERRVGGIARDADEFAADVAAIAALHAPDLAREPPGRVAEELKRRRESAHNERATRQIIDERLAERRERSGNQARLRDAASQRLVELREAAGARDAAELVAIEERVARGRALDQKLRDATSELLSIGEGRDLGELEAEVRGRSPDALFAERDTLETAHAELEERRRAVTEDIGRTKGGLDVLRRQRTVGAEAATDAQEHLARARDLAEQWVRARLSVAVLEREVVRYREANQGPVLARASELFRALTGGAYDELRTAFDDADDAVLCAVRGGDEISVAGLSDGTRDQLYLALRLATLERHALTAPPMPLVLDDVLVHFDDRRARAALEVLAEVGDRLQVLLFTHHARVVEIAREALGDARLRVHRLG